jgi:hypothetical protein
MKRHFRSICLLVITTLVVAGAGAASPTVFDVREFGAVGDGQVLCTAGMNRAVEAAAAAGGGTVLVPAGRFLTGTIFLKSNVTLHLAPGAVIVGSTELHDYPENQPPIPTDTVEFRRLLPVYPARLEFGRFAIISAAGQRNVRLTGSGAIDGNGDHVNFSKKEMVARGLTRQEAHARRPFGLSFVRCREVRVEGVTLRNLASWTQSYLDCDGVVVDGVTVDSPAEDRNNDGIDIDGCRNFRVVNSRFDTGDDAICLKSSFAACENVVVTNCVIRSRVNAVKFGTASNAGFKSVAVSNLTIEHAGAAGIALEVVDGGVLDGVVVSNVVMNEVAAVVFIRLGDRGRTWMKPEAHAIGVLRNVTISNVTARVFTRYDGRPLSSPISGIPGHDVENVSLNHVRVLILRDYPRVLTAGLPAAAIPEVEVDYPEYAMFGSLPAYAFYVRHARGITFDDIDASYAATDSRPALFCDDVRDLTVRGWRSRAQQDSDPAIFLRNVKGAAFFGGVASDDTTTYLRVEGDSADISLVGMDLAKAKQPVSLAPNLPPATVRETANLRR